MTKLEKLSTEINEIFANHKEEIAALPTSGPSGGTNALYIDGWSHSPNGTITRATNMCSNGKTLNYWSGHAPTPSSAIPLCVVNECVDAYDRIFKITELG